MKIIIAAYLLLFTCIEGFGFTSNKKPQYDTIQTKTNENGSEIVLVFEKGEYFNHPSFAIWIEDMEGNFVKNIFVTKSIASGLFNYGPLDSLIWGYKLGRAERPSALPYWLYKCNNGVLPSPENPIPDAYSGATPQGSFVLKSNGMQNKKYRILLEINQTWDWNEYWTNDKYPDIPYKHSSQPSLVYAVTIDSTTDATEFFLNPIGHGHFSGKNGMLFTDISTFTTALQIAKTIKVLVIK